MQLIVSTTSSSEKNNLALYKRRKDGSVELINEFDAGTKPSYHFFDENRSLLFVVNEMNFDMHSRSGTIRSYRIDRSNGKETLLNEVDSRGEDPCFLTMDPDRRFYSVPIISVPGSAFSVYGKMVPCPRPFRSLPGRGVDLCWKDRINLIPTP